MGIFKNIKIQNDNKKILKDQFYFANNEKVKLSARIDSSYGDLILGSLLSETKKNELKLNYGERRNIISAITEMYLSGVQSISVLNFHNPLELGGHYYKEDNTETLLYRNSNLHDILNKFPEYYEQNKGLGSDVYTDSSLLFSNLFLFRNLKGDLLIEPVSFNLISSSPVYQSGTIAADSVLINLMNQRINRQMEIVSRKMPEGLIISIDNCGVYNNYKDILKNTYMNFLNYMKIDEDMKIMFVY